MIDNMRLNLGSVPALEIIDLVKTYSNGVQAVRGINLQVEQGDFFALLGKNGAGKSTVIGIASSVVNKTSGFVKLMGIDLHQDPFLAKRQLGVVPQEFNFIHHETCYQIVMNQAAYFGVSRAVAKMRANKYLTLLGLWDKRNQRSRLLSGGMKRRLMIARALMHEPKILILDEPTAGVDIEIRQSMWRYLRELNQQGITIILTTHYLEEAESLCNKIAILQNGKIIVNTLMHDLLATLSKEKFILYLNQSYDSPLNDFSMRLVDRTTLEIELDKHESITDVITKLSDVGITVNRISSVSNRLEHIFMQAVNQENMP